MVSTNVVIFRGVSFSLVLSWCGVSTVLNSVPIANLNRFQPIARNKFWCVNGMIDHAAACYLCPIRDIRVDRVQTDSGLLTESETLY